MKYIKLFEYVDYDDEQDILDLFQGIADEYLLKRENDDVFDSDVILPSFKKYLNCFK